MFGKPRKPMYVLSHPIWRLICSPVALAQVTDVPPLSANAVDGCINIRKPMTRAMMAVRLVMVATT